MTDAELIARLRDWQEHDEGKINDAREAAADRIEALIADLARSTRVISKMLAEWNRLREAVREGNLEGIQNAFDACEEWIDFAFGQNKGENHE